MIGFAVESNSGKRHDIQVGLVKCKQYTPSIPALRSPRPLQFMHGSASLYLQHTYRNTSLPGDLSLYNRERNMIAASEPTNSQSGIHWKVLYVYASEAFNKEISKHNVANGGTIISPLFLLSPSAPYP